MLTNKGDSKVALFLAVTLTSAKYAGSSNVEPEPEQNAASARIEVLVHSSAAC